MDRSSILRGSTKCTTAALSGGRFHHLRPYLRLFRNDRLSFRSDSVSRSSPTTSTLSRYISNRTDEPSLTSY